MQPSNSEKEKKEKKKTESSERKVGGEKDHMRVQAAYVALCERVLPHYRPLLDFPAGVGLAGLHDLELRPRE